MNRRSFLKFLGMSALFGISGKELLEEEEEIIPEVIPKPSPGECSYGGPQGKTFGSTICVNGWNSFNEAQFHKDNCVLYDHYYDALRYTMGRKKQR